MKKKFAIGAAVLALSLVLAPAAMTAGAVQATAQDSTSYSSASIMLNKGTSSAGSVYITGLNESSTAPAQVAANKALTSANEHSRTAEGMGYQGMTIVGEFYLGIQDKSGNPVDGTIDAEIAVSNDVKVVAWWNAAASKWDEVPYTGSIQMSGVKPGVYRLLAQESSSIVKKPGSSAVPSVQQTGSFSEVTGSAETSSTSKSVMTFVYSGASSTASLTADAESAVKAAISDAHKSGVTVASMSLSGVGSGVVSDEFYLGICDMDGNLYSGSASVTLTMQSASEASAIEAVAYWTGSSWKTASYTVSGADVSVSGHTGVYRIVSSAN